MKALPKRKGNVERGTTLQEEREGLNESPSEKEGKSPLRPVVTHQGSGCLNESPSEKEGKSTPISLFVPQIEASMKALPKRKGN